MEHGAQPIDVQLLLREIARYLAAVDAFRDAGYRPVWRRERTGHAKPAAAALRPCP